MVKKNYKVIWEDDAKASLRRIYNYIKKKESVDQAIKVRMKYAIWPKVLDLCPTNISKILS